MSEACSRERVTAWTVDKLELMKGGRGAAHAGHTRPFGRRLLLLAGAILLVGAAWLVGRTTMAQGVVDASPSPSPSPSPSSSSPAPSPSPSAVPSVEGGQWVVNGATVKASGGLAAQVETNGNTAKANASAAKGTWATHFSFEGGGPVTLSGGASGPGPTVDITVTVSGTPVRVHGTLGQNLTVDYGRAPSSRALTLYDAGPLAAVGAADAAPPDQVATTIGSDWLRGFGAFTIFGWLLILIAPGLKIRARTANRSLPFRRLGLGVILALDIPLASIILIAVGIPFGLWWVGLVGLVAFVMLALAGYSFAGLQVGRLILDSFGFESVGSVFAVPLGVALIVLAGFLPYVGGLLTLALTVYGMGAMLYRPAQRALVPVAVEEVERRQAELASRGGRPVVE